MRPSDASIATSHRRGLGSQVLAMVVEPARYHELLLALARRDLLVRYKQAVLGVAWALLVPLLQMGVFTIVFTRVARVATDLPYPVYAYAGLVPWTFFASSLRGAAASLTGNAALLSKVYFPREVFPFAAVLVALVDGAIASLGLGAFMLYYRIGPPATILLLPLVVLIQLAFTLGLAMLVAYANVFLRDTRLVLEVVLMLWMFATPVVYPVSQITGGIGTLLDLNPMTPLIDAYRSVILRGELPGGAGFAWASVVSVATLIGGWLAFHRAEPRMAEEV